MCFAPTRGRWFGVVESSSREDEHFAMLAVKAASIAASRMATIFSMCVRCSGEVAIVQNAWTRDGKWACKHFRR